MQKSNKLYTPFPHLSFNCSNHWHKH